MKDKNPVQHFGRRLRCVPDQRYQQPFRIRRHHLGCVVIDDIHIRGEKHYVAELVLHRRLRNGSAILSSVTEILVGNGFDTGIRARVEAKASTQRGSSPVVITGRTMLRSTSSGMQVDPSTPASWREPQA